ncbi:Disks large-associated protein 5 [Clonorchis sinensis]|uniref:Disks large-associated protein 5 n=1 Tax=Clonorchis sinensis TaxID=79923 RepID=A0A8T1MEV2_CLOSI|nr:Disks large-associated protein 5 [Clonorchis sinensis]
MAESVPDSTNSPASSESALRSEVLAFFSPSTPHQNSSLTPRIAIVEAAKPQTKTLTVTLENGNFGTPDGPDGTGAPEPSSSFDGFGSCAGYYRLDRLDSAINPTVTAKLDRMAQQLGFHVPSKSHPIDQNGQVPDWDEIHLEDNLSTPTVPGDVDVTVNHNYHQVPPPSVCRKRSMFSNFAKRFSIPRHKTTGTPNSVSQTGDSPSKDSPATPPSKIKRGSSRPRRLRRWLSRHFWRTKPNQAGIKKSEEPFASAEAILEGSNIPSSSDGLGEADFKSDTELDDDSRPLRRSQVRTSLLDPEQARQCASLEELGDHSPLHVPDHPLIPSSARLAAIRLDSRNEQPLDHSSPHSQHGLIQKAPRPPSTLRLKESTPPCALNRKNSLHSAGERIKGHVHFASSNVNIGEVFRPGARVSSLSAAKLFDQQRSVINQSDSLSAAQYTPSYLSISVAAFGYSGYTKQSLSSNNLTSPGSPTNNTSPMMRAAPGKNTVSSSKPSPWLPKEKPVSIGNNNVVVLQARTPSRGSTTAECAKSVLPNDPSHPGTGSSTKAVTVGTSNLLVQARSTPRMATRFSKAKSLTVSTGQGVIPCNGTDAQSQYDPNVLRTTSPSPCPSSAEGTPSAVRLRRTSPRSPTGTVDDHKDSWKRSSLIMLAVSHASRRSRPNTSFERQATLSLVEDDIPTSEAAESLIADGQPAETHESVVENGSKAMNGLSHLMEKDDFPTEQRTEESENKSVAAVPQSPVIDGHYYLRQAAHSEAEILSLIDRAEFDLSDKALDEESSGLLRAGIGKARLLIAEKFAQFRGLCQLNLEWNQQAAPTDPDVKHLFTSLEDLDGFWAIVRLQIDDVHRIFDQIERLRSNDWKTPDEVDPNSLASSQKKIAKNNTARRKHPSGSSNATRKKDDEVARLKARERLETIKREMRAKQQQQPDADGAYIVV